MNCLHPISLPNPRVRVLLDRISGNAFCRKHITEKLIKFSNDTVEKGKFNYKLLAERLKLLRQHNNLDEVIKDAITELDIIPWHIVVPCRTCPNCLRKRQWEWRGRLIKEFQHQEMLGHNCAMVTLTYCDDYIVDAPDTYGADIAKFFDGLRGKYRRSFKHWCIAELGDKKGRFHIHCIIWDVPKEFFKWSEVTPWGRKKVAKTKNNRLHGYCPILQKYWPKGIIDTTEVEINCMSYVTTYLTNKDLDGKSTYFKGAIYCSNGLGMHPDSDDDFWQIYLKIRDDVSKGKYPTWRYGNFDFPVPTYIYNKCVDRFDRLKIQYVSQLRAEREGKFNFLKRRFHSAVEYYEVLKNFFGKIYKIETPTEEIIRVDAEFSKFKSLVLAHINSDEYKENELKLNDYCDEFYIDVPIFDSSPPF